MSKNFEPNSSVWVIERDINGDVIDICNYVFIEALMGYALLSPHINYLKKLEEILQYYYESSCLNYSSGIIVVRLDDCFSSKEEALEEAV